MAYSIEMWRALNRSLQMESRFFKKYLDEHYPGVYEEIKNEMIKKGMSDLSDSFDDFLVENVPMKVHKKDV
ncbi:MAG: hypothetical protein V4546_08225 [Bacteroidota bacterium]|uniref:Uncharacterized protein n=1 Tax=Pedobacter cryotolerans TaxID=2571270 RepID=A0A4U1CAD7_9SPHI|nr:hypothetical protein [Pedobacter cryotolerans]TKC01419.1 hypothetical protein FA045_09290 [Pedobacter cryotolerans]